MIKLQLLLVSILVASLSWGMTLSFPFEGDGGEPFACELAEHHGIDVSMEVHFMGEHGRVVSLPFRKVFPERRLLAIRLNGSLPPEGMVAAEMRLFVRGCEGMSLWPAVIGIDQDGGMWGCKGMPLKSGDNSNIVFAFSNLRKLAFSAGNREAFELSAVREFWFGVVMEGIGHGEIRMEKMRLSSSVRKMSEVREIPLADASEWRCAADSEAEVSVANCMVENERALELKFRFPADRHMYFTPSMSLPDWDFGGYSKLRLTYRAAVPKRLGGVLLLLNAGGISFHCKALQPSGEWNTVDVPFSAFVEAPWQKNCQNRKLTTANLTSIVVGCHGNAGGDGAGTIILKKLELVP